MAEARRAGPAVVIGAGAVGAAAALILLRSGREVVLLDRAEPGRGASFGNAAALPATFSPTSHPDTWRRLPGWLLDRDGPVRADVPRLPGLLPWLIRFLAAGRASRRPGILAAGSSLTGTAAADTQRLLASCDAAGLVVRQDLLRLYATPAQAAADAPARAALDAAGYRVNMVSAADLSAREPALSRAFCGAAVVGGWTRVTDPLHVVEAIVRRFRAEGGALRRAEARVIAVEGSVAVGVDLTDGSRQPASLVVIAAGPRSAALARSVGDGVPLAAERGFHSQIREPGLALHHVLAWPSRGFLVVPIGEELRVVGKVLLTRPESPARLHPAARLNAAAVEVLPSLRTAHHTLWTGDRPSTPDSLPVIDRSRGFHNVIHAFGHGHYSLATAAATARLVLALVERRADEHEMRPFRVTRFSRRSEEHAP